MPQMQLGWHFVAIHNNAPRLRDGTPLVLHHTYEHAGKLLMCSHGYHDSARIIDALKYAPGAGLCRTLASADLCDSDKRVSHYRSAIAYIDATTILHGFAVRIAYCALLAERERGREPDPRSWEALRVKQAWLRGDATDADLRAAWGAAWDAARDAAMEAAEDLLLSMLPEAIRVHREQTR